MKNFLFQINVKYLCFKKEIYIAGRPGACDKTLRQESPIFLSEGAYIFQEQSSMRIEKANNIMMGSKFTIALWLKLHPMWGYQFSNWDFVSQRRYDTQTTPIYSLGADGWSGNPQQDEGVFTFSSIMNQNANINSQGGTYIKQKANITLSQGWHLVSVSADSANQKLSFMMRIRAPDGRFDNFYQEYGGWTYNESNYQVDKTDIYIGGFCGNGFGTQQGFPSTIGRYYVWKNFANLQQHLHFDRFFFRNNGQNIADGSKIVMPLCEGILPCTFCTVGYADFNLPLTGSTLKCTSNNVDKRKYMLADWDFDDPSNTQTSQYVIDQSGTGNHLAKIPVDDVETSELLKIVGQGMLWYKAENKYTRSVQLVQIGATQQFTAEIWFRRQIDSFTASAGPQIAAMPIRITWNQIDKVSYRFHMDNGMGTSVRHQVDNIVSTGRIGSRGWSGFQIPSNSVFQVAAFKTLIYRRIKIYNFIRYDDEVPLMFNRYINCTKLGNQPQCNICPSDTNKCLSVCKENEFGDNCETCHSFCGHCTGPSKDDCVYCARNVTPANVFYSQTFGNCSCVSGKYYNSTKGKCEDCDPLCEECFGHDNSMCLTCKLGKIFYPNTICVNDCKDPLIINGTILGFYETTEQIAGVAQKTCSHCHTYCSECTGPLLTNCQKCQNGYYLQSTNTCLDTCPNGQYRDNTTNTCKPCHGNCKTCTGPNNTNCISCTDPTKVQQNGRCRNNCNDGYFPDSNKVCVSCHESCASCTSPLNTDCQSCNDNYYLGWLSSTCESTCKNGNYADDNTNTCQLCHYSCETCSGGTPDKCIKCAPSFLRRQSFCVTSCADGEYIINGTCMSCDSKCSTCFGIKDNQCYTCAENTLTGIGYFYFNESCLETCPDGYYPDNLRRICRKCNPRCSTCISESFCTSCVYGPYQLNNGECTFFTCLDTQYRTLTPSLSCYECDSTCLTCQGQSKFDCITCKPQFQFSAQQCLSCSQQPGMTDSIDDTPGCVEICGDGFNYGFYQCDDGNMINGDGCSSKCIIEQGFNCTAGSKLAPSVCMDNKNPTPKISLISSKNSIYIEFDEEVQLQQALDENTVKISVIGTQASYKFDWRLADEYKTSEPKQMAIIELSFYSSLKGEGREQVVVQFLTDQIYKDATGNGIQIIPLSANLNKFDYIDPETKAKLDAAGNTSMLATFGAVAINLVISQLFGGSIAAMWTMVNTIQLISLLPLCNINYPQITVMVLEKMLSSHGESTMIPNVFYDYLINRAESTVKIEQAYNDRFKKYGWEISNFLYLSGRKILLWTFIIIAYPFVWYMKKKYADKHKYCRLWVKTEQKFRYTMLLRGVIMSYVSMYLAFVLGIFKMDLSTMENTISAFFAIAFGIILTYLPMQLMNILQRNYEKINTEKFMLAYSTIVKEVNLSHPIKYMYYPVFLMRRALFALQLVLFANNPVQQIGFMSATAFVMIIYVVVIKPQKEKVMIILTAFGEALMLILHLFSIVFLDEDLPEEKVNTYGWLMLCIIGLYILSNWIVIITITVKQLKQNWRDYKQSKIDKKKKIQEDFEYKRWKKKRHLKHQLEHEAEKHRMIDKYEQATNLHNEKKTSSNQLITNSNNYSVLPNYIDESPSIYKQSPNSPFQQQFFDLSQQIHENIMDPTNDYSGFNQVPTLNDQSLNNISNGGLSQRYALDNTLDLDATPNIFSSNNLFIQNQIVEQQKRASFNMGKNISGAQDKFESSFIKFNGTFEPNSSVKSPGFRPKMDRYAYEDSNNQLMTQSFSGNSRLPSYRTEQMQNGVADSTPKSNQIDDKQ